MAKTIEQKYKYMRIQGRELASNTLYAKGVFSMAWKLIADKKMEDEDADLYREIDAWFAEHLPFPEPCMKKERVVCFFKTENYDEMLKMIRPALWLLEKYDQPYFLVYTNTPGEIVYEDQYQVAVKVEDIVIEDFPPDFKTYETKEEREARKQSSH
ncbi:MAG: hypothetical protein J6127_01140 [Clostridiales bacterium]|nr:hypothetical protein [Clostridiales bacterium]